MSRTSWWWLMCVAACAAPPPARAPRILEPPPSLVVREPKVTAEDRLVANNCLAGAPKSQRDMGPTQLIVRKPRVLEHSAILKIPLWVCEHVTKEELMSKRAKRSVSVRIGDAKKKVNLMDFLPDPKLAEGSRSELSDYRGSGYDRGHMAPAADFSWGWCPMESSFYLSNVAPQVGIGFNRGVWRDLEQLTRSYVMKYDEAWIVTGGLVDGSHPRTIGDNHVAVPTHFYKLVVVEADARRRAAMFLLKNEKQANPSSFQTFVVAVDEVERRSGFDFMPQLDAGEELALERRAVDLTGW